MSSRNFFTDVSNGMIKVDLQNENQQLVHSFLNNLILPYIEAYLITLSYFSVSTNHIAYEEENLYRQIQWLLETFYTQGALKYYESCALESIKNAVRKYSLMGVLQTQRIQVKKTVFRTDVKITQAYMDEAKLKELFDSLAFYLPYSPCNDLKFLQNEIRKLTVSDLVAKL